MNTTLAALAGILVVGGIGLTVLGLMPRPERPPKAKRRPAAAARRWQSLTPAAKRRLIIAAVAGLAAYAWSGWLLLLVLVPAALVTIPLLLSAPPDRDVEVLAALDRWVRAVSGSLGTGKSIKDAIRATRAQAPTTLQPGVQMLLARLDDQWPTRQAFYAMADEIDSPNADAVLAALALATERGGTGAIATLNALSGSIGDQLRAAREISTERAKPRVVARQVTLISCTLLGGLLVFGGQYLESFRTPLGMVVLAVLLTIYVASLLILRVKSSPPRRERLIVWSGVSGA